MLTGRYYFTIYYFPARSSANTTLMRISPIFAFPYCFLRHLKLSLSFKTNLKRNLRRVTFGTSTVTFGMSTGRYCFIMYYFPARSSSTITLKRISQLFPFCFLINLKFLFLSIPIYRGILFWHRSGHFWHVDGSLLARQRSLLACRRAVTISLFTIFQPATRPILLWIGFCHFFPFPYYFERESKLSLSFDNNVKRFFPHIQGFKSNKGHMLY